MKYNLKLAASLLAATGILFSFAACGKKASQEGAAEQKPAAVAPAPPTAAAPTAAAPTAAAPAPDAPAPDAPVAAAPAAAPAAAAPAADDANAAQGDAAAEDAAESYDTLELHLLPGDPENAPEVQFGKRHEIKGDLTPEKWSELEPKLPVSALKVAPGQDVIAGMEAHFKLHCSAPAAPVKASDGATAQLIFCSKPDRPTKILNDSRDDVVNVPRGFFCNAALTEDAFKTGDPEEICDDCPSLYVDAAYLSLVSPKDKTARIYPIEEKMYLGLLRGECQSFMDEYSFAIADVQSVPFMGTSGLYVRTLLKSRNDTEHYGAGDNSGSLTYTTWLFAGDKHRLATHWKDTEFEYELHYSTDESKCEEEGGPEGCAEMKTEGTEKYSESYMFYKDGAFKAETHTAKTPKEMKDISSKRP